LFIFLLLGFLLTPLRWGVGKLVESSEVTPLVLPIYHLGFDKLVPLSKPYYPRPFQSISILIGEPLDFQTLAKENKQKKKPPHETYVAVTNAVQKSLIDLERQLKDMALTWS
jgi:monolysocardiolipin acyltransferase